MWFGVVFTGMGASSSTSVVMLAVMAEVGAERAGRASGLVMLGFLAGLGTAPTLFGWTVDLTGSYTSMWLMSIGVLAAAALLTVRRMRRVPG
jgi:cyanate permease